MRPGNWLFALFAAIACLAGIASTGGGVAAAPAPAIAAQPSDAQADVLASTVVGEAGGGVTVPDASPVLAGGRVDVRAGSVATGTSVVITSPTELAPPMFPRLPIMRVTISGDPASFSVTLPYDRAFLDEFGVTDPAPKL